MVPRRLLPTARISSRPRGARTRPGWFCSIAHRDRGYRGALRHHRLWSRAEPCLLNQPSGLSRGLRTVSTDLQGLITVAHQRGATVSDVILTVVAGALGDVLAGRGEHVQRLVVFVPFSIPPRGGVTDLGNRSGVVAVRLPTTGRSRNGWRAPRPPPERRNGTCAPPRPCSPLGAGDKPHQQHRRKHHGKPITGSFE
jgi:hypothetical protein